MTTPSTSAQGPVAGWLTVTDDQINSACLSYRHDFGLMEEHDRQRLLGEAQEWLHAWRKEADPLVPALTASPSPAASPASPSGVRVKPLEWKEQTPPNGRDRFYDHVQADTPFGQFLIEWKSWKPHDSFTISFAGDYVETRYSLEEAKAFALDYLSVRILSALASGATPAATSGSEDVCDGLGPISRAMRDKAEWHVSIGRRSDTVFSSAEVLDLIAALAKPASEPAGGDVREAQELARLVHVHRNEIGHYTGFDFVLRLERHFAALSSSAGPAVEEGFAYRDENGDIAYQAAHPAPATVEMREILAKFLDYADADYVPNDLFDRARAVLAPATEGRKS